MAEKWRGWTKSLRGPLHQRLGFPNQDASLVYAAQDFAFAAAADGLGSRPRADAGARAACEAALRAARAFTAGMPGADLARRVQAEWEALIAPWPAHDCGTTCLLAIACPEEVILGQLGDGLAALYDADRDVCVFLEDPGEESFANVVDAALGSGEAGETWRKWRWRRFAPPDRGAVVLCTDGVSGDLKSGAGDGFIRELYECGRQNSPAECEEDAARWLAAWPVEGHRDDKTIAVIYR